MSHKIKSILYLNRYNKFIDSLKEQKIDGYFEIHHIVPRSMGGSNEKDNLIKLTARQHFIAHWMLWKAYSGKMMHAFFMMAKICDGEKRYNKLNGKTYQKLTEDFRKDNSIRHKGNKYALGYRWSEEEKQNLREKRALQIIPKEVYEKRKLTMLNRIWMNDGNRSYRIHISKVEEMKKNGYFEGRLTNYINDDYKKKIREKTIQQWQSLRESGHLGNLIKVNQN